MVEHDLRRRGIRDAAVLAAMGRVPRHSFVPPIVLHEAYADYPLPIGEGQTISQPYIVARMTEALTIEPGVAVLELGTGSGYQAAVLSECGAQVWTIDRSPRLQERAAERLRGMGYTGIRTIAADGTVGLPDEAPFDRILATGSLPRLPESLLRQLTDGGIFVGPIGSLYAQDLIRIVYHPGRTMREDLGPCRFVPLIGAGGWDERVARTGFEPTP
jgi:protein-L-isoaspartate(D-aspartate) O-methyltransferase